GRTRSPRGPGRRIKEAAVVPRMSPAGEVSNGHQFDRGYPGLDHVSEVLDRGAKRAARRERADMNLQKNRILPRPAPPSICPPLEPVVIDDFAWPEHVMRLEMGGRVRNLHFAIDAIFVERPAPPARYRASVPAFPLR